jgi:hypothetical protein
VRFLDLELGNLLLVGGELLLLVADNSIALDNGGLEFLLGSAHVAQGALKTL